MFCCGKDNNNIQCIQISVTLSGEHYVYLTKQLIFRRIFVLNRCSPTGVTPSSEQFGDRQSMTNFLSQPTSKNSLFAMKRSDIVRIFRNFLQSSYLFDNQMVAGAFILP